MSLGDKLAKLRRDNHYTQEQLAELLGVSRQAVSRWESGTAYPETEKLLRLGRLYHCSMDYLLLEEVEEPVPQSEKRIVDLRSICYERVSETKIGGLPLWHINIGFGRVARGIFSLGLVSTGIVSVGLCSVGLLSLGLLGIGVLALGALALGLVAGGAIAVGILAAGAVAVGVFALGACAIGRFAVGAAALGHYAALGDAARGAVAIGRTDAEGTLFQTIRKLSPEDIRRVRRLLEETVPWYLSVFRKLFCLFLR